MNACVAMCFGHIHMVVVLALLALPSRILAVPLPKPTPEQVRKEEMMINWCRFILPKKS